MPVYRIPTGELLRKVRPETYRRIVDLLAEPREHVSYREIARVCKVGGGTVKAIERAEAESIAESRAKILRKITRVADRAWSTVEDKLENPNVSLSQAAICAGIATEKMMLLSGDTTQRIEINIKPTDIYSRLNCITAEIIEAVQHLPEPRLLPLEAEIISCPPAA